ncbi:MAG TPA: D-alanyl-D-alanine carboxypeptidase [Puia sp.]|jgi:D-alanyl-D-alanine carboxypeptidase/D-alanyl-D-alanine-endopeptidase (penicillin-binding protein 4)
MNIESCPPKGPRPVTRHPLSAFIPAILILTWLLVPGLNFAQGRKNDERALKDLLESPSLRTAHIGVLVYDDSLKKDIAAFQDDKYFVPASNTKLFSLYAGLKYLGDSLVGIRYETNDTAVFVFPSGDPSLLHPDFQQQPVIDFLKNTDKKIYIVDSAWQEEAQGRGWGWDDYNDDYAVERSLLPVYGNFIRWTQEKDVLKGHPSFETTPRIFSSPEVSWKVKFSPDSLPKKFFVKRTIDSNLFEIRTGDEVHAEQDVPFVTNKLAAAMDLLRDTLGKPVYTLHKPPVFNTPASIIYSRPADSVYIPMMHRSDNFFAEQTLLMVSNQKLGVMNDHRIIDSLLKTDYADLPQTPSWADGSGLSRFNLFSPRDFVTLLEKFKNEFGMDRMKKILPTGGGPGTLKNYYLNDSGSIFAKTGSLSGVICLSGYLYTRKNRLLEFSVLVNNHYSSGSAVRKAVEAYIEYIRKNY